MLYNPFATPTSLLLHPESPTVDIARGEDRAENTMNVPACQPQGTWRSSLCGGTALACLVLTAASSAVAQHISVGIKAGVPLTGLLRSDWGSGYEVPTQTRRYTIGPVVDIGLLLGFGVEVGALYKRFDQQSIAVTTTGFTSDDETSVPIQQTAGISAVGQSWEFPIAVQYHFFKSAIRPYVEGGVSLNRLSNVYSFQNVSINFRQLPFTFAPLRGSFTRVGPLFGMGVDVKLHRIHVTPGLRYMPYNKLSALTACSSGPGCGGSKAVDFLVGFTF